MSHKSGDGGSFPSGGPFPGGGGGGGGGGGEEARIGDTVDDPKLKVEDHDDAGLFFSEDVNEIGVSVDAKKIGGFAFNEEAIVDIGEGVVMVPEGRTLTVGDLPTIDNKPSTARLLADG